jgi:hypothetical protein
MAKYRVDDQQLVAWAPIDVMAVEVEQVDDFFTIGTPSLLSTRADARHIVGHRQLFGNVCGAVDVSAIG